MGVGLLVGVWVARYLGPERYGILNYSISFVYLFTAFATLGLNDIVIREIINAPRKTPEIMGAAFMLRLIGGIFAFIMAVLTISVLRPDDAVTKVIVFILAAGFIFESSFVIQYFFQAIVLSKYIVLATNMAIIIVAVFKIVLILSNASVVAFGIANFSQVLLGCVLLVAIYHMKQYRVRDWIIKFDTARLMLKDSWPLMLSGIMSILYMRIDQVMIGQLMDNREVGIYSSAVKISEIFYVIPVMIVISFFPIIIKLKKSDESEYYNRLQQLYSFMTWFAIVIALPISFLSNFIINLIYGVKYQEAGVILAIHVWASIFAFQGITRSKWLVTENLQRYSFICISIGTIINIVLNYFLIPPYGGKGAAIATIFTHFAVAIAAPLLFKPIRISSVMLIKSFSPHYIFKKW